MPTVQTIEKGRQVTGYHQVTGMGAATGCPGNGSVVLLQAEAQAVRYRPDGVDPTATVGVLLPAGQVHTLNLGNGKIPDVRVIETTPGAILNVVAFR